MTNQPLVSVMIATFQRPDYLNRAINSVFNQTYKNIELIIVDDNDGENVHRAQTREQLQREFGDKKFLYIEHEHNKGLPAARNTGISHAKGEYFAFLDDDDEWLPQKIKKQVELFQRSSDDVGIVGCYWKIINEVEDNEVVRKLKHRGDLSKVLGINHFSPPSTVMVKALYFFKTSGFDEDFKWREDIEFYYRLSFHCKFEYVEEVLVNYYIHKQQLSGNTAKKLKYVELFLSKHKATLKNNSLPLSELNEVLGELYAFNHQKGAAAASFVKAYIKHPGRIGILAKLILSVLLSSDRYRTLRKK